MSINDVIKTANISRNILTNFKKVFGTGITLTKDEIKVKKKIKKDKND